MVRPLLFLAAASLAAAALLSGGCRGSSPGYDVTVTFNDRYSDAGLAEIDTLFHSYDAGATAIMQPTFPPIVRVTLHSRRKDVCPGLEAQLRARPEVAAVTCRRSSG